MQQFAQEMERPPEAHSEKHHRVVYMPSLLPSRILVLRQKPSWESVVRAATSVRHSLIYYMYTLAGRLVYVGSIPSVYTKSSNIKCQPMVIRL